MKDYSRLPEGITLEEQRRCFLEFLFDHQQVAPGERQDAFHQLCEIAHRDPLEVLDQPVRDALSDFILRNVDFEDAALMDAATSVIVHVGLKKAWDVFLSRKDAIRNPAVVRILEECALEVGDHVEDPYWSMREQIRQMRE